MSSCVKLETTHISLVAGDYFVKPAGYTMSQENRSHIIARCQRGYMSSSRELLYREKSKAVALPFNCLGIVFLLHILLFFFKNWILGFGEVYIILS